MILASAESALAAWWLVRAWFAAVLVGFVLLYFAERERAQWMAEEAKPGASEETNESGPPP